MEVEQMRDSIRELQALMANPGMPESVIESSKVEVYRLQQSILAAEQREASAVTQKQPLEQEDDPEIAALKAQLQNVTLPESVRAIMQNALDEKHAMASGAKYSSAILSSPHGSESRGPALSFRSDSQHYNQPARTSQERFVTPPGSDVGSSISAVQPGRYPYPAPPSDISGSQQTLNVHDLARGQNSAYGSGQAAGMHDLGIMYGQPSQPKTLMHSYSTATLPVAVPMAAMPTVQSFMELPAQIPGKGRVGVPSMASEALPQQSSAGLKLIDKKTKLGSNAQDLRIAAVQHKARELDAYAADREKRLDRYQQDLDQAVIRARDAKQVYRALMDSEDEDLETKKRKDAKIVQLNSESNELDKEIRKGNEAVGTLQGSIQTRKLVQQGKLFGKKKFDAWLADAEDQVTALVKKVAECKSEKSRKQQEVSKLMDEIEAMREKHSEAQHRRAKLRYEEAQREVLELEDRMDKFQHGNKGMLDSAVD